MTNEFQIDLDKAAILLGFIAPVIVLWVMVKVMDGCNACYRACANVLRRRQEKRQEKKNA